MSQRGKSWEKHQEKDIFYVLHYKLRVADNALKGTYNVTLNWYTGEGWTKGDFPIYIDPKKADFVVGALFTSPEKLIADTKEAKLSVDINNIGKGNAENVKVKLFLPEGFNSSYSYSEEDSLGIIAKDGSKTATFYTDIDENTGNKKAESVSLRVFKDASQPFEFSEKSDFVGKLGPGDDGDAVLGFTVDPKAAAKKYLLDVELRGIDESDNVVIFRRTVPLTVTPEAKGSPLSGMLGILVVLIGGAIAVTYYFKNGRKFW